MPKRSGGLIISSLTLLSLIWMYCAVPEGPDAPSKTSVKVVTENSEGDVFDYPIEESTGKNIRIGAAMYLPDNIKSVDISITEKDDTVYSETFSEFENGFYDTAWLECSFATAGVKKVTITPESDLNLSAVTSSITIVGEAVITESPKWLFDTIPYSMNSNSQIALDLSRLITGAVSDNTIFELQSGSPDDDEIVVSTYEYNASEDDIGTHFVAITVSNTEDDEADLLVIKLTVEDVEDDTTPPQITLISPPDTNLTITDDTYTIALLCSDASGVASVTAAIGEHTVSAELLEGYYQISLAGLSEIDASEIVITAVDASENSNTSDKTIHILTADQIHSVTYSAPGDDIEGEVPVDNKLYAVGVKVDVAGNTGDLEKDDNTFIGWNTEEDGSGDAYTGGAFFTMGTEDVTLYAQWTDEATYSVSYDGNGNTDGEAPVDDNRYVEGASATVRGNTGNLEKDDEIFTGWNTEEDGSGTSYGVEESFVIDDDDVTLYAQWSTETVYTVTYDGNDNTDGDVPVDADTYIEGATVTVKSNSGSLVKTGFTFIGWNIEEDGSGKSYTPGATFTMSTSDVILFAQWSGNPTFTVTYDGNDNTGGEVPQDETQYEEGMTVTVKNNTGDLVKTGSAFIGWNTEADGSGDSYTGDASFTIGTSDLTLYAQWSTEPTFTITYDGNGNTSGDAPTDGTHYEESMNATIKENSGELEKTGSTFTGWNTEEDGSGDSYTAGATLTMGDEDVTLYAQWSSNPTFTVTYDGNDNTGGDVPTDGTHYEEEMTVTVRGNTGNLVKTGFIYSGWNTETDGSGTDYDPSATFEMGSEDITLYAQWTLIPTYTVSYDGNDNTSGSVPVDDIDYEEGMTVTVKRNTGDLIRTGYTFTGWNTAEDGSGTDRAPEATFEMDSDDVTLYAQWSQNPTFTVAYDGNGNTGGSVPEDDVYYEEGMTVTVKTNSGNLARTDYTFTGWNTEEDGSGTGRAPESTFEMETEDVILYAQWTRNPTYTVTYNGNGNTGGAIPTDDNNYEEGREVTVMNQGTLTRNHYTFAGWNTEDDGSGTERASASTFYMGNANVTLYAQWTQNPTYTVTYNGNGNTDGSAPADNNNYEEDMIVTVSENTGNLERTGYTLTGWNTRENGGGTERAFSSTFTIGTEDVVLYAHWTQNPTYTVTYDGNGNTGGDVPEDNGAYEEGMSVTVSDVGNMVRSGYTFTGWNTAANGSGTSHDPLTSFSMGSDNITLHAQWTALPTFTVTYDGNDNTSGSPPSDATHYLEGASVVVLAKPSTMNRTGYTFEGWNTADDGSGTPYTPGASFTIGSNNITLYADWELIPTYNVIYNGNNNTGGSPPTDNTDYLEGATAIVLARPSTLTRTGYTFVGWNTSSSGGGDAYSPGSSISIGTSNITLYANWEEIPTYNVTYNGNNNTGGSPPTDNSDYQQGASVTVRSRPSTLVRTGYTFEGWNTSSTGNGLMYQPGESFSMPGNNVTLYAAWDLIPTSTITYYGNGPTGGAPPAAVTREVGSTMALATGGTLEKRYYSFTGWNTIPNGSGTGYAGGQTIVVGSSNLALYAQWEPVGMVWINSAGKTYNMGQAGVQNATPVQTVSITDNIWMDRTEITQKEYTDLMTEYYPSFPLPDFSSNEGDNMPAFGVCWYGALLYCNARTKASGSTDTAYNLNVSGCATTATAPTRYASSKGFRLPYEFEWEYCCRGNTVTSFPFDSTTSNINNHCWWSMNSNGIPHVVATKQPNPFGLYDMMGNVFEWCWDWDGSYTAGSHTNPIIEGNESSSRMIRGGSINSSEANLRSASRFSNTHYFAGNNQGFRVCKTAE